MATILVSTADRDQAALLQKGLEPDDRVEFVTGPDDAAKLFQKLHNPQSRRIAGALGWPDGPRRTGRGR